MQIAVYKELMTEAQTMGDTKNEYILEQRIKELSERFINFRQEVQRVITSVEVLRLSKAAHPFYKELIQGMNPLTSRDSHKKIFSANHALNKAVRDIINSSSLEEKMDHLEILQNIIDNDFTVIYMVTNNKDDAFRLFQVINDRGTNLTVGDLLRSKTLEILEGFPQQQDSVERFWDDILSDIPSDTENYLNWIYESYKGDRAKQSALFDMFLDGFFPQHQAISLTLYEAKQVYETVKSVHEDILKCRKLVEGQWLYAAQQPITSWDRSRLSLLIKELGHTLSIPLFLAASRLEHRLFSDIVQIVEKTFFRYKIVCNQNVTPLKNIYYQESLAIRRDPSSYKISSLRQKLQNLIDSKASNQTFKNALETLEYKEVGGSNKPLKYFLMTVEYYYQWYKNGAIGTPVCTDKNRVYDFAGTSIEHIYPQNAVSSNLDTTLEPLKNTLGNLTILDPAQNSVCGNDPFTAKRLPYQASTVLLTREIAAKTAWLQQEINDHKNLLIDIAMKAFYP